MSDFQRFGSFNDKRNDSHLIGRVPNVNVNNVSDRFSPTNNKEYLAAELAKEFKDEKNRNFYLWAINQLSIQRFNNLARIVKDTPDSKIKNSRAAFFVFLVKKEINDDKKSSYSTRFQSGIENNTNEIDLSDLPGL